MMKRKNYWNYVKKSIKNYNLMMKISKKKKNDLVTQYIWTRKTKLIRMKKRKTVVPQDFEETESENWVRKMGKKNKLKKKVK